MTRLILFTPSKILLICLLLLQFACAQKVKITPAAMYSSDYSAVIVQENDDYATLAQRYLGDKKLAWYVAEFNKLSLLSPLDTGMKLVIPSKIVDSSGIKKDYFQKIPVLCYHNLTKDSDVKGDLMRVFDKDFESQMQYLKDNDFHVISLPRMFDFIEKQQPLPKKSVVITFDDGWRSTYEIAFPILKKFDYPFTIFVYTDLITGSHATLSWDMLKEMHEYGVDIQNHTKAHLNLATNLQGLKPKEYIQFLEKEITLSAEKIKKKIGKQVDIFAYPYGAHNTLVKAVLNKLNYRGGLTVERGGNAFFQDPLEIHRTMVFADTPLSKFASLLQTQQKMN